MYIQSHLKLAYVHQGWAKMGEISTMAALMQETAKIELVHPHSNQREEQHVLTHIHMEEKKEREGLIQLRRSDEWLH